MKKTLTQNILAKPIINKIRKLSTTKETSNINANREKYEINSNIEKTTVLTMNNLFRESSSGESLLIIRYSLHQNRDRLLNSNLIVLKAGTSEEPKILRKFFMNDFSGCSICNDTIIVSTIFNTDELTDYPITLDVLNPNHQEFEFRLLDAKIYKNY